MSGGHWNYRNEYEDWRSTLPEVIQDIKEDYPRLAARLKEIDDELLAAEEKYRAAFQKITHDLDWAQCGDTWIEDRAAFEAEALAKLQAK